MFRNSRSLLVPVVVWATAPATRSHVPPPASIATHRPPFIAYLKGLPASGDGLRRRLFGRRFLSRLLGVRLHVPVLAVAAGAAAAANGTEENGA